jgi:hypothetical protein
MQLFQGRNAMSGKADPVPQYPESRNDGDTVIDSLERTLMDAANGHLEG